MGGTITKPTVRHILVVGYYYRSNFGDQAFITSLSKAWSAEECVFADLELVTSDQVRRADLIVLGGGDVLQEYFLHLLETRVIPYKSCPLYAIGVSMPYVSALTDGRCDMIDRFWCRNDADVTLLRSRFGDEMVQRIPDLAVTCPIPTRTSPLGGRRVGIAFSMSLVDGRHRDDLIAQIGSLITRLLTAGYQVHWLAFNTDVATHESDVALYNTLPSNLRLQVPLAYGDTLLQTLVEMDVMIASRFHAHVFAYLAGVPVVSVVLTRKVEQWNRDYGNGKGMITLPRKCEWCEPSRECKSCEAYVGWVTSLPLTAIMHQVHLVQAPPSIRTTIPLCSQMLESIRTSTWSARITPPYYVEPISALPSILESCWQEFLLGELSADQLASIMCLYITSNSNHPFHYGLMTSLTEKGSDFDLSKAYVYMTQTYATEVRWTASLVDHSDGLFSLSAVPQHRLEGQHRSGWAYVVEEMKELHSSQGPLMDTFLDRTFGWDVDSYRYLGLVPYRQPWMGFLHHPPQAVFSDNDSASLLARPEFQASLPYCQALFVLATDLKEWLIAQGITVPIHVLTHPTDGQVNKFTWEAFQANPTQRVLQIGAWLRDPYAIYRLSLHHLKKTVLSCKDMNGYIMKEPPRILPSRYGDIEHSDLPIVEQWCQGCRDRSCRDRSCRDRCDLTPFLQSVQEALREQWRAVEVLDHLPNDQYDLLLQQNVVFLPLLKAEAVNTVLDCIVRETPLIVARLPAVVEYLGPDYPGYYESYHEAGLKLDNFEILRACYDYLHILDKSRFTASSFLTSIRSALSK